MKEDLYNRYGAFLGPTADMVTELQRKCFKLFREEFGGLPLAEYRKVFNEFYISLPVYFSEDLLGKSINLRKKDREETKNISSKERIEWHEKH